MVRADGRRTRRELLRTGTGALAAGTTAAVAGCTGLLGGGDGDGGLVAHYDFDGDSADTAADDSGNGNDATIDGASRTDQGKVDGALSFDGEDDVVETPVEYSDLSGGLTLEAWARNDDLSGTWAWIFSQRDAADQWSQLGAHEDGGGKLRWELLVDEGTQATVDAPEGSIEEGSWHHWAGTWAEGEGLRLYIDAELVATSAEGQYCFRGCEASNTQPLASQGPINIGAQGKQTQYWTGAIDEARIYDRALTGEEIDRRYDETG